MNILGLNFFHPNAAAAIFVDGQLVAAAEEERYNRIKFSAGIPLGAIGYCLKEANLDFTDIDVITYARSTNTRVVDRNQVHFQDRIYKISSIYDRYRINLKLINFKETLAEHFGIPVESLVFKLQEQDHHLSHLFSDYFYSPFDQALLVSSDAFGDFVSLKTGIGRGNEIEILDQSEFPHSLGLLYTMVTQFLGFPHYGDESKVMGLSTFGQPEQTEALRAIISREDHRLRLNLTYFEEESSVGTSWSGHAPDISQLYNDNLEHLLGPGRAPEEPLTERHQNIAASLQELTEEILFSIITDLCHQSGLSRLVLTGGLAFNSLLNARVLEQTPVEEIYVPPSPGNSGLCIGSALALLGTTSPRTEMTHAFWGSSHTSEAIGRFLADRDVPFTQVPNLVQSATDLLLEGHSLGWFQGRMEFGPRSLGHRCILINPQGLDPHKIKARDDLKPFGISILEDHAQEYFSNAQSSPFMSLMGLIRPQHRKEFENILLNNFCRYQTVGPENQPLHQLLLSFQERTSLPFLINTSLNPEGEPIVESPEHLVDNMEGMHLDCALLEDLLITNT
jgi:carbamoyltransferase